MGWLLLQVADVILNNIDPPDRVFQAILLVTAGTSAFSYKGAD